LGVRRRRSGRPRRTHVVLLAERTTSRPCRRP
jgi:hypothetical protein